MQLQNDEYRIDGNGIWKPVVGYEGLYEVSNTGMVRSVERDIVNKNGFITHRQSRLLKARIIGRGYLSVALSKNNKVNYYSVHRLVAIAFIPNERNKIQVNHKDGIKTNNNVSNLEWTSQSENMRHALDNFDNKHLKRVMILETKEIFKSLAECARQKGLNQKCISECINGRNKTHKKYHFIKVK